MIVWKISTDIYIYIYSGNDNRVNRFLSFKFGKEILKMGKGGGRWPNSTD